MGGGALKEFERQGEVVGIKVKEGRFESFVLFFTLGCQFCHELSVFVPFQKYGSILKRDKLTYVN